MADLRYSLNNGVAWTVVLNATLPYTIADATDGVAVLVEAIGPAFPALGLTSKSFAPGAVAGSTIGAILGVPTGVTAVFTPTNGGDAGKVTVSGAGASSNLVVGLTASTTGTIPGVISAPGAASLPVTLTVVQTALLMGSRYNQPGFNGYSGSDGTDTNSNSRTGSYNETGATVTKLTALFANWMANSTNEQDGYNSITITAAVEYPSGTFTALTFSGASSKVLTAGAPGNLVESDEVTLATPIPAGALYWVRSYVSVTAGGKWVQQYRTFDASLGAISLDERTDFNTAVDKTTSGTITNATPTANRRAYGPVAVKATGFTGTPVTKAFAAAGDSLFAGATDNVDAATTGHGNNGYFGKACATYYPVLQLGIAGTSAQNNQPANFTRRGALLAKLGAAITHFASDWSINDTIAGRTAAQQAADISAIAAGVKALVPGIKVVWATQCPYTEGTYLTAAGQAVRTTGVPAGAFTGGAGSVRAQINALIRAGLSNVDVVFDATASVEVNASNAFAQNGGLWVSGNAGVGVASTHLTTTGATTDAGTSDGLHPTSISITAPGFGAVYLIRDAMRAAFAGW